MQTVKLNLRHLPAAYLTQLEHDFDCIVHLNNRIDEITADPSVLPVVLMALNAMRNRQIEMGRRHARTAYPDNF